jgi:hypothetical protein
LGRSARFTTARIRYGALFDDTRILSQIALMALAWDMVEGSIFCFAVITEFASFAFTHLFVYQQGILLA